MSECWNWPKISKGTGYGLANVGGKTTTVHRLVYRLVFGKFDQKLHIDHLCMNRACINPSHLEAVTLLENIRRGNSAPAKNGRKTHCIRGHAFSASNTRKTKRGRRHCKACEKIHKNLVRARKILKANSLKIV